jgi:hypothetical protein
LRPSIDVDTCSDSAACRTLPPKTVRNNGKSAATEISQLALDDATDSSKKFRFVQSVCYISALNSHHDTHFVALFAAAIGRTSGDRIQFKSFRPDQTPELVAKQ